MALQLQSLHKERCDETGGYFSFCRTKYFRKQEVLRRVFVNLESHEERNDVRSTSCSKTNAEEPLDEKCELNLWETSLNKF
jgi:hypothetical protein